jgi:hypothetical protein
MSRSRVVRRVTMVSGIGLNADGSLRISPLRLVSDHPNIDARHQKQQDAKQECKKLSHHLTGSLVRQVEVTKFRWLEFQSQRRLKSGITTITVAGMSGFESMGFSVSGHRQVFPSEIGQ